MAATEAAPQPSGSWDEAQCTAALAQLERLKAQLDDLRLTIPRVVQPFHSPPSPALFQKFKQGLISSQNDIKRFRSNFHSQDTQAIFDHARQSYDANPDLSASTQVQQYGWIEKEERGKEAAKRNKDGTKSAEEDNVTLSQEDITKIVENFRNVHSKFHIAAKDNNHDLTIQFVADASKLRFHVSLSQERNEPLKLHAECLGSTDPYLVITRCIASRPNANDLKYLLDMIAAYKTVKGTACAKCGKMLDSETAKPLARRSRSVGGVDEKQEAVWEALHESCLG